MIGTIAYIKEEFRTKSTDWYGKETRAYFEDIFDSGVVDNYDALIGKYVAARIENEGEICGRLGGIEINSRNFSVYTCDRATGKAEERVYFLHELKSLDLWREVTGEQRQKIDRYVKEYDKELDKYSYRGKAADRMEPAADPGAEKGREDRSAGGGKQAHRPDRKPGDSREKLEVIKREMAFLAGAIQTEKTIPPQVTITPYRGETTVFSSKFGGVPYFPKEMEYPVGRGRYEGCPLRFLAQLNFSEIPHIGGFPESGILQFFAGSEGDRRIGADREHPDSQDGFRVIFHEDVIADESRLMGERDIPGTESAFPFAGEYALEFGGIERRIPGLLVDAYNQAITKGLIDGERVESFYEPDNGSENSLECREPEIYEELREFFRAGGNDGCKIGGIPHFPQSDADPENDGKKRTLLLQIDSVSSDDGEVRISWGDCGTALFFISPEDLKNRDFSRVSYLWECY